MKSATLSALFFAASIALAIAYPARNYYYEDEYPEGKAVLAGRPISLASAPFYYQARTLEIEQIPPRGRKYQIVKKKKKNPGGQGSEEEDGQDEEASDESSEEEEDEEEDDNNEPENNEEESLDVPPWEELFPEEDKNTGTFQDQPGPGGQGGGGGSLADLPTGAPAPQGSGSLFGNLFGGGGGSSFGGSPTGGPQSDIGSAGEGPPPQYRQGPPPQHYQPVRARTSIQSAEEPRSGGAVLYDGYRYIPVKPVQVRVPKRQAKKIKPSKKVAVDKVQGRSLKPTPTSSSSSRQTKKLRSNSSKKLQKQQQYVLVPVGRNNREIRFSRDQHGLKIDSSASFYSPTEIWRWEGPGGRPLRRRENRPSGLYYSPRPQRGSSSTIRFAEENDY